MIHDPHRSPLESLPRPVAPEGLRDRVLAAARRARVEAGPAPRPSFVDRLWTSRPLRLAWAASMAGLIFVNVALSVDPGATSSSRAPIDLEAIVTGLGPSRPTVREALASLEVILCDGLEECARDVIRQGDAR